MWRSLVRLQCQARVALSARYGRARLPVLWHAADLSIATSERKKFYQDVNISQREDGLFEINLDRRKLKTPGGKLFTVPNEALAVAVATEWDVQKDTLKFYTMNLTTLCNTALDNPTQRDKEQIIAAALKFLETDTIWYNVIIGSSSSIMGPQITEETKDTFRQHLGSYNFWALTGLEFVITQLKSLVLSFALVDRHLTVEQAVLLSRLEEEYQIQRWGNVEWAHDYDMYELRARTAAGTLFVHLSSESSSVKRKLLQD
ncbi:ATP synthase mitochondrial F1 complex assembly factor 2 isoform X3 [Scleropages formosus]|uniref:ATP synthase mitochondrial F1 complex assembly factor 2 n=1 Tax=Scleropages formosus TaxID=113540 RepID=A0A8C9SJ11_SCLFO|nr:ATP synthase mitochondrial F1 complex assembly factor 2 isoform X3 [Scleropages formosus]